MGGNEESMRENRNAIYITMVIALMSLLLASLIEYCECISKKISHSDFIVNCFLGVFSGAMLALIIAVINYRVERKRFITERINFVGCLILELMPFNSLIFKGGNYSLEKEIEVIKTVYYFMRDYVHMKPNEFQPFFSTGKLVDKDEEIMLMIIELYTKIEKLNRLSDEYTFNIIHREQLENEINNLLTYLKKYKNSCYTNILGRKRDELQELVGIKYDHEEKMDF